MVFPNILLVLKDENEAANKNNWIRTGLVDEDGSDNVMIGMIVITITMMLAMNQQIQPVQ